MTSSFSSLRGLSACALLLWAAVAGAQPDAASGSTGADSGGPGAEAVRRVFDLYRSSLIAGDGATAVSMVDRATFDYFDSLRSLALEGSRVELEEKRFVERLLVITLREMLTLRELEELTLEELITRATGEGWLSADAVGQLSIGEIQVEGGRARAEALTTGGTSLSQEGLESLWYEFRREDGEWRFEFASLVASLDVLVTSFTSQLGADDEALIFMLVEGLTGAPVLPSVWDPPSGAESPAPHKTPEPVDGAERQRE